MNRDIKFRGKSLAGHWELGDLSQWNEEDGQKRTFISFEGLEPVEVIPDTVGQFTGFCDRMGNEIYEGDIIHAYDKNMRVVWHAEDGQWVASGKDGICLLAVIADFNDIELVVGNIHDTPKLLKDDFLKKHPKQSARRNFL